MDPTCCHMIFENLSEAGDANGFEDFRPIFLQHSEDVIEETSYHDRITGRSLLVVKIDPDRMETIKQELLNLKLPENVIIYMFSENREIGKTLKRKNGKSLKRESSAY